MNPEVLPQEGTWKTDTIDLRSTVGWVISQHAETRGALRWAIARAILETAAAPDLSYPSRDRTMLIRGQLATVVDAAT